MTLLSIPFSTGRGTAKAKLKALEAIGSTYVQDGMLSDAQDGPLHVRGDGPTRAA